MPLAALRPSVYNAAMAEGEQIVARIVPWARGYIAALVIAVAVILGHGLTLNAVQPDINDAGQYVAAGHHLATTGVFSESAQTDPAPGLGREPGYGAVLGLLFTVTGSPIAGHVRCLATVTGCGTDGYGPALWLNPLFIGLSGFFAFVAAKMLTGRTLAGWIAGGYLWLNIEAAAPKIYLISDWLAVFLACLLSVALILAVRKGWPWLWGSAGLVLAALTLTKGVFLPFAVGLLALGSVLAIVRFARRAPARSRALVALVLFAAAFSLPTGAWMARNQAIGGAFSISTGRTAIVLSAREILNDMTPRQMMAGVVYWTRGFGDDLAKALWPEEVWRPLVFGTPGGFYLEGHARASRQINALMEAENLSPVEAEARVADAYKHAILSRPLKHLATTVVLFWRGLWSDEFIVFGLPALAWAAVYGVWRRRWDLTLAVSPGLFSLSFYPLVSLNVERYQMTALPSLAIAAGVALAAVAHWLTGRRQATVARRETASKAAV